MFYASIPLVVFMRDNSRRPHQSSLVDFASSAAVISFNIST